MTPADVLFLAREAAMKATNDYIKQYPDQWWPCGFAWVEIRPARGPFVTFLKKQNIGRKGHDGGWHIWNPGEHSTQWMDAKFEGAVAFAKVLKENGINAVARQRMD